MCLQHRTHLAVIWFTLLIIQSKFTMKKVYYLSTCDTCKKILRELQLDSAFELQDIKTEPITEEQLEHLRSMTDSYESLFSRRSRQYRSRGLHEVELTEQDYKKLILEEYTFLKRPVIVNQDVISIGNAKKEWSKHLAQRNSFSRQVIMVYQFTSYTTHAKQMSIFLAFKLIQN